MWKETLINKTIENRWLLFITASAKKKENKVFSSDIHERHVRFTTFPIKPLSVQGLMEYHYA